MEPLVIHFWESYLITLCLKVGRVTVDPRILSVVLTNDILKVLVLYDDICQSARAFPYQVKEAADITRFAAKGFGAATETVANQFEVICGTADISTRSAFQHKSADGFSIGRLQVDLCQIHFLLQVIIRKLTSGEELVKDVEVIPRIQRQEAQF